MRFVWMGTDWSMRQNLNTCGTDEVVCCKRLTEWEAKVQAKGLGVGF